MLVLDRIEWSASRSAAITTKMDQIVIGEQIEWVSQLIWMHVIYVGAISFRC
jgi:hypothetical protein